MRKLGRVGSAARLKPGCKSLQTESKTQLSRERSTAEVEAYPLLFGKRSWFFVSAFLLSLVSVLQQLPAAVPFPQLLDGAAEKAPKGRVERQDGKYCVVYCSTCTAC